MQTELELRRKCGVYRALPLNPAHAFKRRCNDPDIKVRLSLGSRACMARMASAVIHHVQLFRSKCLRQKVANSCFSACQFLSR